MEKVISVEHLHKHLKNIYFHGSEGEFYMEFTAATAEAAKYVRSSFNAFMVHAPGNMNFNVDNNLSDKVKTGELGFGAVRVSGNIHIALNFLLSRRLVNEEIHKLIVDDKDLTSFLQQSSLYKSNDEDSVLDVIEKTHKDAKDNSDAPQQNTNNTGSSLPPSYFISETATPRTSDTSSQPPSTPASGKTSNTSTPPDEESIKHSRKLSKSGDATD